MTQALATQQTQPAFYFEIERTEMLPYVSDGARRTLEVGCAAGRFSRAVKDKTGCETWGIELDPVAADLARSNIDFVKCGSVDEIVASLPANYFDHIIFNDVLEHLADPFKLLLDIKRILSADGRVVASIPNIRYVGALRQLIFERDFRYSDYGIFDRTHLRFFTVKSIRRTFKDLGYELIELKGLHPANHERGRYWKIVKALSFFDFFSDMQYLQFAVVSRPSDTVSDATTKQP